MKILNSASSLVLPNRLALFLTMILAFALPGLAQANPLSNFSGTYQRDGQGAGCYLKFTVEQKDAATIEISVDVKSGSGGSERTRAESYTQINQGTVPWTNDFGDVTAHGTQTTTFDGNILKSTIKAGIFNFLRLQKTMQLEGANLTTTSSDSDSEHGRPRVCTYTRVAS